MDIIVDQSLANLSRDITVVATVICEKKDNGKYDVEYQGQPYYDVPVAGGIYHKGNQVLMLVPQGNFDNDKTILSKIDQNSPYSILEDKYDYIGSNLITVDTKYSDDNGHIITNSTLNKKIVLWDSDNSNNSPIQINAKELTNFVQLYRKFKFSAIFETSFIPIDDDDFYELEYGIKFIFKNPADDSKPHIYTFTIDDVSGYPYSLNAEQIKIFEIDKTVPIGELQKIELYVQNSNGCKADWKFTIKKPSILGAIDPETEGRTVRISTIETGSIINEDDNDDVSIKLTPVVRRDGEQLTIADLKNFTFTWRIQDKNKLNSYRPILTKVVTDDDTADSINLILEENDLWHKNSIITCEVEEPGFTPFATSIEVINNKRKDPWFTLELINTEGDLTLRTDESFSKVNGYRYRYTWKATDSNGIVQDINDADETSNTVQGVIESGYIESPNIHPTIIANQWNYNCVVEIGTGSNLDDFNSIAILDSQNYIVDGELDLSDIEVDFKTATIYCTTPALSDENGVELNEDIKTEILSRMPWPRPETPKFNSLPIDDTYITTSPSLTIQDLQIEGVSSVTFIAKWTWYQDISEEWLDYVYESKQQYTNTLSEDGWSQPRICKVPLGSTISVSAANLKLDALNNTSGGKGIFEYDSNDNGVPDSLIINADYITTGALEVTNGENTVFSADIDTKEVRIAGWEVDGQELHSIDYDTGIMRSNTDDTRFYAGLLRKREDIGKTAEVAFTHEMKESQINMLDNSALEFCKFKESTIKSITETLKTIQSTKTIARSKTISLTKIFGKTYGTSDFNNTSTGEDSFTASAQIVVDIPLVSNQYYIIKTKINAQRSGEDPQTREQKVRVQYKDNALGTWYKNNILYLSYTWLGNPELQDYWISYQIEIYSTFYEYTFPEENTTLYTLTTGAFSLSWPNLNNARINDCKSNNNLEIIVNDKAIQGKLASKTVSFSIDDVADMPITNQITLYDDRYNFSYQYTASITTNNSTTIQQLISTDFTMDLYDTYISLKLSRFLRNNTSQINCTIQAIVDEYYKKSSAPFSVTKDGKIRAEEGYIGGWHVDNNTFRYVDEQTEETSSNKTYLVHLQGRPSDTPENNIYYKNKDTEERVVFAAGSNEQDTGDDSTTKIKKQDSQELSYTSGGSQATLKEHELNEDIKEIQRLDIVQYEETCPSVTFSSFNTTSTSRYLKNNMGYVYSSTHTFSTPWGEEKRISCNVVDNNKYKFWIAGTKARDVLLPTTGCSTLTLYPSNGADGSDISGTNTYFITTSTFSRNKTTGTADSFYIDSNRPSGSSCNIKITWNNSEGRTYIEVLDTTVWNNMVGSINIYVCTSTKSEYEWDASVSFTRPQETISKVYSNYWWSHYIQSIDLKQFTPTITQKNTLALSSAYVEIKESVSSSKWYNPTVTINYDSSSQKTSWNYIINSNQVTFTATFKIPDRVFAQMAFYQVQKDGFDSAVNAIKDRAYVSYYTSVNQNTFSNVVGKNSLLVFTKENLTLDNGPVLANLNNNKLIISTPSHNNIPVGNSVSIGKCTTYLSYEVLTYPIMITEQGTLYAKKATLEGDIAITELTQQPTYYEDESTVYTPITKFIINSVTYVLYTALTKENGYIKDANIVQVAVRTLDSWNELINSNK